MGHDAERVPDQAQERALVATLASQVAVSLSNANNFEELGKKSDVSMIVKHVPELANALTNDATDLAGPKYQAARTVADSAKSEWTTCR